MKRESERETRYAVAIVETVPIAQRPALKAWAEQLLAIEASPMSRVQKARAAMHATRAARLVWPVIKTIAKKVRHMGWDARSGPARAFLGVAAVSAAVFGGKAAGVAALGTAIGIPLWVVFGAGAGFATAVVREVARTGKATEGASYTVIDADRRDL